jgi:hypothetical protein
VPRFEDEFATALGAGLSIGLGVTVRVCRAATPVPEQALTVGERRQWRARALGPPSRDWLLGRAALKALLPAPGDSSVLSFPHRLLSLTHAGGTAFAVAIAGGAVAGTGVDFEPWRTPDPRMARFFLRPGEHSTALGLLRAWTVKEALYKAIPDNSDVTLLDVGLDDPGATTGTATGPSDEALRYTVIDTAAGPLAAAVCLEARRVAV